METVKQKDVFTSEFHASEKQAIPAQIDPAWKDDRAGKVLHMDLDSVDAHVVVVLFCFLFSLTHFCSHCFGAIIPKPRSPYVLKRV